MNPFDRFLTKLFVLSRRSPELPEKSAPPGWETPILAHWRVSVRDDGSRSYVFALRWAALAAVLVAGGVAGLWRDQLFQASQLNDPQTQLASSAINVGAGYDR